MNTRRTFVVVNPLSGNGYVGRNWPKFRRALSSQLHTWDHDFSLAPKESIRLAREAVMSGYEQVIAVGGDGTTQEVITGLWNQDQNQWINSSIVFASVHAGTGGDFHRFLGTPKQIPASVEHLTQGIIKKTDIGFYRANIKELKKVPFLNIASFGLAGEVDQKVNEERSMRTWWPRSPTWVYLKAIFRAWLSYKEATVRIYADGLQIYEGPAYNVVLANAPFFGGGLRVVPTANPWDGILDVLIHTKGSWRELLRLPDVYRGKSGNWSSALLKRAKKIRVEVMAGTASVDLDGESAGFLQDNAEFELFSESLNIIVPKGSEYLFPKMLSMI